MPSGARCKGIESLWRSMNWGDIAEGPEGTLYALKGPIMTLDAAQVEKTWKTLPDSPRTMLKFALVKAEHPRKTCRRLNLHWLLYDEQLLVSALALRNSLQSGEQYVTVAARVPA
jgi:hypothetical protein